MDQTDDFEFKPLTEGLGFHKKNTGNIAATPLSVPASVQPESRLTSHLAKQASIAASAFLSNPLPRQSNQEIPTFENKKFEQKKFGGSAATAAPRAAAMPTTITPTPARPQAPAAIKKTNDVPFTNKAALDFQDPQYVAIAGHVGAYFFDLIVVLGLSCLFALSLSLITEVDLMQVLNTISFDVGIQVGTTLLVSSVILLYMTLSRGFFGCTLGEWAFDMQLGKQEQQLRTVYPIQVFWRTAATLLTGVIVLPAISLILGKDIASRLGGLQLYKQ